MSGVTPGRISDSLFNKCASEYGEQISGSLFPSIALYEEAGITHQHPLLVREKGSDFPAGSASQRPSTSSGLPAQTPGDATH